MYLISRFTLLWWWERHCCLFSACELLVLACQCTSDNQFTT